VKIISKIKQNICTTLFIFSLLAFILSQLVANSILAPLGTELQKLNSEKNYLVEENRGMEEEIAKSNSITVIRQLADKSLSLSSSNQKTVVYLQETSVVANK